MPDFENDEIRDSSFPVEFNDETETLDMYGVWVKSGPRDVSSLVEEDESGSVDTVLPVFSDVPDISEFDELPDIEDFDAESTEPDMTEQDVVSDELSPDTSFELPDFDTPEAEDAEESADLEEADAEVPEIVAENDDFDFGAISFDELDSVDEAVEEQPLEEIGTGDDDTLLEEDFLVDMETDIVPDTAADIITDTTDSPDEMEEIADFDIVADEFDYEVTDETSGEEILVDELEIAVNPDDEDLSPTEEFSVDTDTESFSEPQEVTASESFGEVSDEPLPDSFEELAEEAAAPVVENDVLAELDPELADFSMEDFSGIADMINAGEQSAGSVNPPDEDDFSSLLDDINSGSAPRDSSGSSGFDDLDLDDFINEINDSGGTTEKEKEKLFSDVEPVDIDLEFDEEFIENSEKIRAAGSSISEAEFENSEFGVEFVDETGSGEDFDGFESFDSEMFAEEDGKTPAAASPAPSTEDDTLEIASEFDDLLASLETARPAAPGASELKEEKVVQEFNLNVTEEDGLESVANEAPEMNEGDDFNVPLFSESPGSYSGEELPVVEDESATIEDLAVEDEASMLSDDDTAELEIGSVDLSSLEEFVQEEIVTEDESIAGMVELEPEDSIPEVSLLDEESPEPETESFDSLALSGDTDEGFTVLDSDDDSMEIVEKDILDITGESDYNEYQSGISDSDDEGMSIDFDDVGAFEESLHESGTDTGEIDVTSNDKSTELLMLIAEELSSIKKELSTLNSELSTTMKPVSHSDNSSTDSVTAESSDNTGFFSDDDTDETIALTGDELNNILITADFTEEKTGEPELDDFDDMSMNEIGASSSEDVTADFSPEEESTQFDEIAFDDDGGLNEPEELDIPDVLTEDEMFGTNDITDEVEVSYVNKVEEDVSYLEGSESVEPDLENVAIEESDIETLDFNDEHLEEPELTEFNIDFSAMEDSIGSVTDESEQTESFLEESIVEPETETVYEESVLEDIEIGETAVPEVTETPEAPEAEEPTAPEAP
ncbi:MAG TPA: hypothetical protein PLJ76_01575, partial [Treponemataceae bacterium]|nr:hypothetical protein [Treponemataceae bacterium]